LVVAAQNDALDDVDGTADLPDYVEAAALISGFLLTSVSVSLVPA